jgi:hypothetical protein
LISTIRRGALALGSMVAVVTGVSLAVPISLFDL